MSSNRLNPQSKLMKSSTVVQLSKMQVIADTRADPMSRFHNALYAGDVSYCGPTGCRTS